MTLFFDDPKCMQLYAACADVGLPVLFHMDGGNNKDDADLSHLENALKTYPNCRFIGHGPWSFDKKPPPQFRLVEELVLPFDVKSKVYQDNAIMLFRLAGQRD